MNSTHRRRGALLGGALAVAVTAGTLVAPPALAAPHEGQGKANGSGQYGLIGNNETRIDRIYGVTVDGAGSIWYTVSDGADRGITELRAKASPGAGDYAGNGTFADGSGLLGGAWEAPRFYAKRDSTPGNLAGGGDIWAEPRGIITLPNGGVAVNDTNGNTAHPVGSLLFYDAAHESIIQRAGFGRDEGCAELANGELAWGPYFAVLNDRVYAPYEGCNVVSVFDLASGTPEFRLTGVNQTAGRHPNPIGTQGPGDLDDIYGVSTDGSRLYTSDLGNYRGPSGGLVQRWTVDPATESWALDPSFAQGGGLRLPAMIYTTAVEPVSGDLFVVPSTGPVRRFDSSGAAITGGLAQLPNGTVALPGEESFRDVSFTAEGWMIATVKGTNNGLPSLRVYAESPNPTENLVATPGAAAGTVELSWDAAGDPANPARGQAPVLDYVVERSEDGGASWATVQRAPSTDTALAVTGLAPGEHLFRVAAWSEAGRGDLSATASAAVPAAAPAVALSLGATPPVPAEVGGEITWTATAKNAGNAPLSEVSVRFDRGAGNAAEDVAVGALAVGEERAVTATTAVTAAERSALLAANGALVSGEDASGQAVTATASAETALTPAGTTPGGTTPGGQKPGGSQPGGPLAVSGSQPTQLWLGGLLLLAAGAAATLLPRRPRRG